MDEKKDLKFNVRDINMKKSKVENRILGVVTYDEYCSDPDYRNPGTGVVFEHNGKQVVLPHRTTAYNADRPGVYNCGPIDRFVFPTEEDEADYTQEIIDLTDIDAIGELNDKIERMRGYENEMLMTPDNIFTPVISDTDSPEMKGIKEAVIAKHIDIDKYSERFGDNFPNDKRQFKKGTITLFMMKRMCEALDMKASIVIEDSGPNVPNPIGKPIVIDLLGEADDEDENEEE